jgi:hypothetical protein
LSLKCPFPQTVYGFLQGGKPVDPSELESFLDDYLVNQFATEADDNSPYEAIIISVPVVPSQANTICLQVSHLICRLFALISAGNLEEAQSLLKAPTASLDACIEASSDEDSDCGEEDMQEDGADCPSREPDTVQLTAEQQADLDDGWGVVVKTTRGRRRELGGMDQS